ncbi:MAG: hypothetical protein Q7R67_00580 [bacterium]|nr:hypothetical protein [bacterium]
MEEISLVLVLGVIFMALLQTIEKYGLDLLILWLAEGDKWWSPVRKLPSGGHIHLYTKGWTPGGDFASLLHGHIVDWYFHKKDQQFYHKDDEVFATKFPRDPRPKSSWARRLAQLGVGWVGLYRQLYRRHRKWEAMDTVDGKKSGEEPSRKLVLKETKKGEEHIFYFSTPMALNLGTIQPKSAPGTLGGRVTGMVSFNAFMVNPPKAEFIAGKWENQTVGAVRSRIREHVQNKTAETLQSEIDTSGTNEMVDAMARANTKQVGETATVGLIDGQGIKIDSPRFEDFDYVEEGGDKDVADSMRKITIAENELKVEAVNAEKAKVRGTGKAMERKAEAEGIAAEFAARMSVPQGAELSLAEAVRWGEVKYLSLNQQGTGVAVTFPENP